jgi:DNA-directed RNA polymerase specialized sigma24 family protein
MKNELCPSNLPAQANQAELAHLAQQGQVGAFSALFDLHKATVYPLCLRSTGSVAEAEQLTHDIFLDAFRNLATCSEGRDFSTLVNHAAVNRLQMRERKMHLTAPFIDHLVTLAAEPVDSHRAPTRFAYLRAQMRHARGYLSNQLPWGSVWTRFARPRQTAKALS